MSWNRALELLENKLDLPAELVHEIMGEVLTGKIGRAHV